MALHRQRKAMSHSERQVGRDLKLRWVAEHGLVCPGWHREPHPVESIADFDVDHVVPRVAGGRFGPLRVLCQSCNRSRKAQAA
jgi:hypothetical protein